MVACLDQPADRIATIAARETMQHCENTLRRDFKNRAVIIRPTDGRCAVKVSVGSFHQPGRWSRTIGTVRLLAKTVQCCQFPVGSNGKYRSMFGCPRCSVYPESCAVEISVFAND